MREREREKKRFDGGRESFRCISVLVRHTRGKGIFVALDVNDGCGRNYIMRGLMRLFCFLFVRAITVSCFL